MNTFSFHNPVRVHFGRGCVGGLAEHLVRPALLVAGRATLARSGLADLVDPMQGVFASPAVPSLPTAEVVEAGAALAHRLGVRMVVGIGGGSALDAAKVMAGLAGQADTVDTFVARIHAGHALERHPRLTLVPTTAGTGSEVTPFASLWGVGGSKSSVEHGCLYADDAFVDPDLTVGTEPRRTAASGLDALAHGCEALWGVNGNPISDVHARSALELIGAHLLPAVQGASDSGHREALSRAALHGGLALSNTRTAVAHALSYGLTGRFGLEHGLAVGLLCRGALALNARLAPERVQPIVDALGCPDVTAAQARIDAVFVAGGVEPSLRALGVPDEAHGYLVDVASSSDRLDNNPGPPGPDDLRELLESVA